MRHLPIPFPEAPVRRSFLLMVLCVASQVLLPTGLSAVEPTGYLDQEDLRDALRNLARANDRVTVSDLVATPGEREVRLVTVRPAQRPEGGTGPAILVVADPLGTTPLATAAAVKLASLAAAAGEDGGDRNTGTGGEGSGDDGNDGEVSWRPGAVTWYIVPAANPDGSAAFFASPRCADGRNDMPFDDDKDGDTDEDGPDDLNGDGLITTMLVQHPEGSWLLSGDDPPLPKEADPAKGERGLYQHHSEGADDDGDGLYNEDGPGGVVVGKNFPHAFVHWTSDAGPWAASTPESRAILEFAFSHPEIAMVLVLGSANTLAKVPESGNQVQAGGGKYTLPKWMASRLGIDPETEFDLETLVQMGRDFTGNQNLTAEDVLSFLELGAAVNPNRQDLPWWNELSTAYQDFLKAAGLDGPRVDPAPSAPGSAEEWAYYQFGVPSFAVDFWAVPKAEAAADSAGGEAPPLTSDDVEKMSRDEFIALGDERIEAFLRANDAPAHITAQMVIDMLKNGMLTPGKIAQMMRERAEKKEAAGVDPDLKALAIYSKEHLEPGGLPPAVRGWDEVELPDGRKALVGGAAPFALRTPPAAVVDSLLDAQVPFLLTLPGWLPRLTLDSVELEYRGTDVYEITAYVANSGRISYPTGQGKRCRRPPPVVLTLEGAEVLEGRARQVIKEVPALGASNCRWLVSGARGDRVTITATTPSAGTTVKTVDLDREGGLR